jgi:tRNA G18 (ribose-2'-O)-methylase SpoU
MTDAGAAATQSATRGRGGEPASGSRCADHGSALHLRHGDPRRRPTVVMLGCERSGMSQAQRRVCDITVSIPMAPGSDSLNVGVAAGILLFAVRHP